MLHLCRLTFGTLSKKYWSAFGTAETHKFISRSIFYPYFSYSPPFYASDPMKTYNIILRGMDVMEFPKKIGRNPQNLIRRLCRESPTERLGYQKDGLADVKNHK